MPKRLLIVTQHFWPENFRINDMVDGFLADGIVVDILCGLPNYPQGEWFVGYDAHGPLLEDYHGANLYRCREIPRKGNTSLRIFLNYIAFPLTAACSLHKLPGGYDAVLCYNTSPVLMSFPAILAARKFKAPLTNYVLDLWPENLYSVLPIQNKLLRKIASAVSDWHYRRADRLIAMNQGLQQRLWQRVGDKNAKGCQCKQKAYAIIPQYCEDFYDCKQGLPAKGSQTSAANACPPAQQDAVTAQPQTDNINCSTTTAVATTQENTSNPTCTQTSTQTIAATTHPFTILFAGNVSPAQSLNTALDAMALLRDAIAEAAMTADKLDTDATSTQADALQADTSTSAAANTTPPIRLVLVGDGMSRAALQAQAQSLQLGEWVQFCDSVPATQIPALAAKADALLLPLAASADLGLTVPAKFASCMAAGKPLLVSMDGEGARVAAQSGGALVSPAADATALAQNILMLAATPAAQRAAMGEASHAYYKAHFNRSALLQQIETFIF